MSSDKIVELLAQIFAANPQWEPMTFEQECRSRLAESAKRLATSLAEKEPLPPLLIALEVAMLIRYAEGFCGEFLYRELLKHRVQAMRSGMAYCQYCDTKIPIHLSHPPICEPCDRRIDAETDEMVEKAGNP